MKRSEQLDYALLSVGFAGTVVGSGLDGGAGTAAIVVGLGCFIAVIVRKLVHQTEDT